MTALLQEILNQKRLRRQELAALPFPEKVRIVEKMRGALSSIAAIRAELSRPSELTENPRDAPQTRR